MESRQAHNWEDIPAAVEATIERWLQHAAASFTADEDQDLLEAARRDADTVAFTQKLLQLVAGTDDALLGAIGMRKLAQEMPAELPRRDKLALRAGSLTALGVPWAVLPMAKRWLRDRVAGLVCAAQLPSDSTKAPDHHLVETLTGLAAQNTPAIVALHGEAVLGPEAAHRELRRLLGLAYMPEVEYLLVELARLAPGDEWASDARAKRAVSAMRQLIQEGAQHGTFVVLTAANYSDSKLCAAVANQLLADPDIKELPFSVTLHAEDPEAAEYLTALAVHAAARQAVGGAELELRISVRSTASAEAINSLLTGLQFPVFERRAEIEAAALRLLQQAACAAGIQPVLASDSPYLVAAALAATQSLTAEQNETFGVEVRSGLATELLLALTAEGVPTRVNLPLVSPSEFSAYVPQLIAMTTEAADPHSALARQRLLENEYLPAAELRFAEQQHITEVCELALEPAAPVKRVQDRGREWDPTSRDSALFYRPVDDPHLRDTGGLTAAVLSLNTDPDTGEIILEDALAPRTVPVVSESGFAAEPGTDVSRPENRNWFRSQLAVRQESGQHASTHAEAAYITDAEYSAPRFPTLQSTLTSRARVLRRIALASVAARDSFTQIFAAATVLNAAQIDAQLNNLIDSARFLAQQAESLERVRGATFSPAGQVLLSCDDVQLTGDVLSTLLAEYAAGNAVTLQLPASALELAATIISEWRTAGMSVQACQLLDLDADLAAADFVRATTFGSGALRRALLRTRPGLPVHSRNHQLGVATVTPSADYDAAAQAIVQSAFAGDDNGLRSVRMVIAIGSAARSEHFKNQLADAVRLVAGSREQTTDLLQSSLPPLASQPTAAELQALTALERGQQWLVTPRQLDDSGLHWSPGIKLGVSPDSEFWHVAEKLPVIGVVSARSLREAAQIANTVGSGAVASLYSWDPGEIMPWLDRVQAASLTVNRPSCMARVERLPSGVWSGSASSIAPLTGGPHQLLTLGAWQLREGTPSSTLHLRGLEPEISVLIETAQEWLSYAEFDRLRRAALADALTWRTQLGVVRDTAGLGVEHNILRYWPVASHIRVAEDTPIEQLVRVLSAALLVRAPLTVSTGMALPDAIDDLLFRQGIAVQIESDEDWMERVAVHGPSAGAGQAERIRMIGGNAVRLAEWLADRPEISIWAEPVTMAGPVELLSFLREQSVSIANHRGGMLAKQPEIAEWLRELGR